MIGARLRVLLVALAVVWGWQAGVARAAVDGGGAAWRDGGAWPVRWGREDSSGLQGVARRVEGDVVGWRARVHGVFGPPALADDEVALLVEGFGGQARFVAEGRMSCTIRLDVRENSENGQGAEGLYDAAAFYQFVSGQEVEGGGEDGGDQVVAVERAWFALYEPFEGEARGVALVMPGLFGTPRPVVDQVVAGLRSRGWVVVRMLAQPSRFTQIEEIEAGIDAIDAVAERVARLSDSRAAECAYAVEGVFSLIEAERPGLVGLPRVAVGMSGGAMTLPAVVARDPGSYSAAVLIAGGANVMAITRESNYREAEAITLRWRGGEPGAGALRELDSAYLAHSRLDAYHTAEALRGVPVLMIHGSSDRAVPAWTGDLLWERLGEPERWVWNAGHELLFVRLGLQSRRVLDWLDGAVASGEGAGGDGD